ncbi:FecR family protein [Mucilaginibacter pineti]|uniref:FecR family protein n=1 Tax=Mucilaginibacter pineti TaxID=1391627 RepID=A0A1G7CYC5_9SPHI|nr:FecR domain-containing protein [Mucilaginibacter pineti]SDE44332.1 FecR family protein [Mucilaginibacter pineti]
MNKEQFLQILTHYLDNEATKEEEEFLHAYYNLFIADADVIALLKYKETEKLKLSMKSAIDHRIDQPIKPARRLQLWPMIRAAAAILLLAGGGLFFYEQRTDKSQLITNTSPVSILSGSNKAILTLSNGKKISLTDAANGVIAQQPDIKITKSNNGQLVYTVKNDMAFLTNNPNAKAILWNTITTPKGGQWQIVLPDGSKVWLNAASSLTFPEHFTGNVRKVQLQGEAYFEVAHNKSMPFHVSSLKQDVEVLGTHFNVNAYDDNPTIKTTLLEGAVKITRPEKNGSQILKPDQEAILSVNDIKINNVDAQDAVAWKEGVFLFNDDQLDDIMKRISRWYDVEVEFKDREIKKDRFSGTVSRFAQISQVLRKLEVLGGVAFKIEGRKILVQKK